MQNLQLRQFRHLVIRPEIARAKLRTSVPIWSFRQVPNTDFILLRHHGLWLMYPCSSLLWSGPDITLVHLSFRSPRCLATPKDWIWSSIPCWWGPVASLTIVSSKTAANHGLVAAIVVWGVVVGCVVVRSLVPVIAWEEGFGLRTKLVIDLRMLSKSLWS